MSKDFEKIKFLMNSLLSKTVFFFRCNMRCYYLIQTMFVFLIFRTFGFAESTLVNYVFLSHDSTI